MRRAAEIIAAQNSVSEGVSARTRDAKIESRPALTSDGVEITSCIEQEFTKSVIYELRFTLNRKAEDKGFGSKPVDWLRVLEL